MERSQNLSLQFRHYGLAKWTSLWLALALLAGCIQPEADVVPAPISTVTPRPMVEATHVPVVTAIPTVTLRPTTTPTIFYTATPTIEPIPTDPYRTIFPPTLTPTASPTYLFTGTPVAPIEGCVGTPASANLLLNGGFEGGQQPQGQADIQVPDGWMAFWIPVGTQVANDPQNTAGYQPPDTLVIPSHAPYNSPPRVFEGIQAFRMTGNGRAFDAGIMQQVTVTPGEIFCLSGYGHAWSSFQEDDPFHSTLLSSDDRHNASFQLGIDPSGGVNPWASTVVWGQPANIYDEYQPLPPVQTASQHETITVFVRGIIIWRFAHNEMFFDAMTLARFVP
jgi:hypothetical protein